MKPIQKWTIAIVGAGFGGLQAAQSLAQSGKDVLLIVGVASPLENRNNYHTFVPLLYQVATAQLEPEHIIYPARTIIRRDRRRHFLLAEVEQIDFAAQTSATDRAEIEYDFLVIATGSKFQYLGVPGAAEFTFSLDSIERAVTLRNQILEGELPPKLGIYTQKYLQKLGVEIQFSTRIDRISSDAVYLQDGRVIETKTVIWTAGVEADVPELTNDWPRGHKQKLRVLPTLQSIDYPNVYAIGDVAYIDGGKTLSGVAPEALQQGVAVARNIARQLQGRSPQPFSYFNKGRLAIIGCHTGVGQIQGWKFTGFLAWIMWLGVHLVYLPGYRNRLFVLLTWLQTYLFGDRVVRSILPLANRVDACSQAVASQKIGVGTRE